MDIDILLFTRNRHEAFKVCSSSLSESASNSICRASITVVDSSKNTVYDINKEFSRKLNIRAHIRAPAENSMAQNWQYGVELVEAPCFMIITDRSIFHLNSFNLIDKWIMSNSSAHILSWKWNTSDLAISKPCKSDLKQTNTYPINFNHLLFSLISQGTSEPYPYFLPRALNCIAPSWLIKHIEIIYNEPLFSGINPDYNFAFKVLHSGITCDYLDQPLFTSSFLELSNGGNSAKSLNYQYLHSIPDYQLIIANVSPLPLISSTVASDYLFSLCRSTLVDDQHKHTLGLLKSLSSIPIRLEASRFLSRGLISAQDHTLLIDNLDQNSIRFDHKHLHWLFRRPKFLRTIIQSYVKRLFFMARYCIIRPI